MGRQNDDATTVAPRPCMEGFYASSDIHSPRYLNLYIRALAGIGEKIQLMILAGDIIDKGKVYWIEPVLNKLLLNNPSIKIIAVFGNEEYSEIRDRLRSYTSITWLEDDYMIIDRAGCSIGVIGTTGSLDRPTRWQRRNIPGVENLYKRRVSIISELIEIVKKEADITILVSHYAVSNKTIIGEPRKIWPELYSSMMERVLIEKKPDMAIHGHAHNGRPKAVVGDTIIYNVALPLNRNIVRIMGRIGIDSFLQDH